MITGLICKMFVRSGVILYTMFILQFNIFSNNQIAFILIVMRFLYAAAIAVNLLTVPTCNLKLMLPPTHTWWDFRV